MKNILHIVNFIRGCEPRLEVDLILPVKKQIEISEKYNFPTTFLLQYDALIKPEFIDMLINLDDKYEIGAWLEFNKPLTEKAGIPWKGREGWDWDYHTNVAFTPGYTVEDRKKLIDITFNDFKEVFGFYPKSIGAWVIDAFTLNYVKETYGVVACCICKDQWGTDGYTLWGGYYNGAYYPSKFNSYLPAQTIENQMQIPVFRMLGSDPIYQYEASSDEENRQGVVTLEPVYGCSGSNDDWVDWFFETNFKNKALSFAYTQMGQENSFGWPAMEHGYTYQAEVADKYRKEGILSIEKMSETGKWYIDNYKTTPPATITAFNDWGNKGNKCAWYYSKNYRINIDVKNNKLTIRDIHLFDDKYEEFCLNSNIDTHDCKYNALPIYDRFLSELNKSKSLFNINAGDFTKIESKIDENTNTMEITNGNFSLICKEDKIIFKSDNKIEINITNSDYIKDVKGNTIICKYEDYEYKISIENAVITKENNDINIVSKNNEIVFCF